jgi:hypothetical protein
MACGQHEQQLHAFLCDHVSLIVADGASVGSHCRPFSLSHCPSDIAEGFATQSGQWLLGSGTACSILLCNALLQQCTFVQCHQPPGMLMIMTATCIDWSSPPICPPTHNSLHVCCMFELSSRPGACWSFRRAICGRQSVCWSAVWTLTLCWLQSSVGSRCMPRPRRSAALTTGPEGQAATPTAAATIELSGQSVLLQGHRHHRLGLAVLGRGPQVQAGHAVLEATAARVLGAAL